MAHLAEGTRSSGLGARYLVALGNWRNQAPVSPTPRTCCTGHASSVRCRDWTPNSITRESDTFCPPSARMQPRTEPDRSFGSGHRPEADCLGQPAAHHRRWLGRSHHDCHQCLQSLCPAASLGFRKTRLGRWDALGSLRAEPRLRIPHPLRQHRLLPCIRHLHSALQPLHPVRRLRGRLYP
jgi:hypothetical protein